jgi:hypothetical protein
MIRTPEKIKHGSEEINKKAIQNRDAFAKFMEESGLHDIIKGHLQTRDGVNPPGMHSFFVGGSQAWKKWAETEMPANVHLTPMERSALTAGNFDVFYVSDTEQGCKDLTCQLYEVMAQKIKKECDDRLKKLGYPYKLNVKCYGFKSSRRKCTLEKRTIYTIFPSYSMMFTLDAGVDNRQTRKAAANIKNVEHPFHGKLALYIEMGYVPDLDINTFQNTYLYMANDNLNYLNRIGLITFAMMISESRTNSKGLDVDMLRRQIMFKTWPDLDNVYSSVALHYNSVFGKCKSFYNDSYVNRVQLEAMKARSLNVDALCDTFEEMLVEKLRPYINAFIYYTDQEITTKTDFKSFMFIVGGDAMRRYKKSISKTKDIDAKVYVPNSAMETEVMRIVKKNMARFVTFLIQHKARIFGDLGSDNFGFAKEENGVMARIKFLTTGQSNVQFRMREIRKSPFTLPVQLFSVDYRAYFQGTSHGRTFNMKYDIPIVDIAIQMNPEKKTRAELVQLQNGLLPVASLNFLLHDIIHTYEDEKLTAMRTFAKKRNKDLERFYKLRAVHERRMQGLRSASSGSVDTTGVSLDAINPDAVSYIHAPHDTMASAYEKMFTELHKKRNTYKYKMPFDASLFTFPVTIVRGKEDSSIQVSKSSSMRTASMRSRTRSSPSPMSE